VPLKNKTLSLYADTIPARRGRWANPRIQGPRRPPTPHKFSIGQTVFYSPGVFDPPEGAGIYKVVRLLPAEGNGNQYRLQAGSGGQERVAYESKLSPR